MGTPDGLRNALMGVGSIESQIGPCLSDANCPAVRTFMENGNPDDFSNYAIDVKTIIENCERPCALATKCAQFVIQRGTN